VAKTIEVPNFGGRGAIVEQKRGTVNHLLAGKALALWLIPGCLQEVLPCWMADDCDWPDRCSRWCNNRVALGRAAGPGLGCGTVVLLLLTGEGAAGTAWGMHVLWAHFSGPTQILSIL